MADKDGRTASDEADNAIFTGVHFAVVPNTGLSQDQSRQVINDLETNGAIHCPISASSSLSELRNVTHLIADSCDFPAYQDAVDGFIHVVRPTWVEFSLSKNRPANPRQYRPDPSLFLGDVILVVADDIPQGDRDAITGGLLAAGGQYSAIMTKLVTHVIALSMDASQAKLAVDKKLSCKIVLPHWFDDCLKLGKKLQPAPYCLPDPPVLHVGAEKDDMMKHSATCDDLQGASRLLDPATTPLLESPSKQRRQLGVFRKHAILLAGDLSINNHLRASLVDVIQSSGGEVVKDLDLADTLVCRYRSCRYFAKALEDGKDIGNLTWLWHLINTNRWTSPMRRLLHFPIPEKAIRDFDGFTISVSNYTGEARVYLESLIKAAGGKFTKTMTQENTHLITAHTFSEKVDAAKEWNINIVNHLWLEESYARCKVQSLTNGRYTTFPSRTNLGEIVGQTPLDRGKVEDVYLQGRASQAHVGQSEVLETNSSNAQTLKTANRQARGKGVATPVAAEGKENETPGSRSAKDRALNKLHRLAPDIALFEKESKRVGGVIYGGRRVGDADRITLNRGSNGKKRASSGSGEDESEGGSDDQRVEAGGPKTKKQKKTLSSDTICRIIVTGGQELGWTEAKARKIRQLGLEVLAEVPRDGEFDVLVAPRVMRTAKFFAAVAGGRQVVGQQWIEEVLRVKKYVDPKGWALRPERAEKEQNGDLRGALMRAQAYRDRGGLFAGMTIYFTEHLDTDANKVKEVVKYNGGTPLPYKGRETKAASQPAWAKGSGPGSGPEDEADEMDEDDRASLFLVSSAKDRGLWSRFRSMAEQVDCRARVVLADWLLQAAMEQDLGARGREWELKDDGDEE